MVLLVGDKNTELALRGLLSRPQAPGIRPLQCDIYPHPRHDPGCRLESHQFLRSFVRSHDHALVVFDREGCGRDASSREALEQELENALSQTGWADRATAIVIDPELEAWVWSESPHVEKVLARTGRDPTLRQWLQQRGLLLPGQVKPDRPKEAMLAALRTVQKPPSSSLFEQLAKTVGLTHCADPAFLKLTGVLKKWFPS